MSSPKRLFQIYTKIVETGTASAAHLAEGLGVSERTIYRDIERLRAATRDATYVATRAATCDATYDATCDATYDATDTATHAATRAATRTATYAATSVATHAATYDATRAAINRYGGHK